jgi:hypothetical protein
MELNLNYEALISDESSEYVETSESNEGSENGVAIESSNPMSPVATSSIFSCSS